MDPAKLQALLEAVRAGRASVDEALGELRDLPYRDIGYAHVDHHRHLRTGMPEVVLGLGKSAEQVAGIVEELARTGANVLVTRATAEQVVAVKTRVPAARDEKAARAIVVEQQPIVESGRGTVLVVCAGTSDLPVAEEAALVAEFLGAEVVRVHDVGVAGVHRLLARLDAIRAAAVVIAVAGMEAALPSVLAGLIDRPLVAVPTSVGYGVSLDGLVALGAMLASCAPGITAVNIDNGVGAAVAAVRIARLAAR